MPTATWNVQKRKCSAAVQPKIGLLLLQSPNGLQVVFGKACCGGEDEFDVHEQLKEVIKGCLNLDHKAKLSAKKVQERLFSITQQKG